MILLAFVAQKLVTSSSQPAEQPTFTGFQKELTEGKVSQVTMQTKDQELEVTLKDGKTARQLLGEQLGLLDAKLREVVANLAASDAAALVANGLRNAQIAERLGLLQVGDDSALERWIEAERA